MTADWVPRRTYIYYEHAAKLVVEIAWRLGACLVLSCIVWLLCSFLMKVCSSFSSHTPLSLPLSRFILPFPPTPLSVLSPTPLFFMMVSFFVFVSLLSSCFILFFSPSSPPVHTRNLSDSLPLCACVSGCVCRYAFLSRFVTKPTSRLAHSHSYSLSFSSLLGRLALSLSLQEKRD